MKKELQRPVINAIFALILIILVRIVAMVTLKKVDAIYSVIGIALSLAVVVVLLRFMREFNRQLAISSPEYPQARPVVKWFILLLAILTLYGAFSPFAADLPYDIYYIVFFILALIPVYSLWNILYKNIDKLSELLENIFGEEKLECSCGWINTISAKFCNRCGLSLEKGGK
ncbi:MAG: hypothetical protein Q8O41_03505 [Candidatus Methanoperedens sp.]|nr:hypothetical protein [Candidatus Methanoperedens sp.]